MPDSRRPPARCGDPLTDREIQILALVATGATNGAIGARLGIGSDTVRKHLGNVFRKTGARDRVAAARHFVRFYTAQSAGDDLQRPHRHTRVSGELSQLALQIRAIHLRLERDALSQAEALRLRHALHALRALNARRTWIGHAPRASCNDRRPPVS
jgi:DNA-binding CsgD family transcriptional regulator